jgi:ferrous iron transport protein A
MSQEHQAVMSLDKLAMGQVATIVDIKQPDEDAHCRMLTLGIYPGVRVEVLRTAPMGDPMQIRCGSILISIRKADASFVEVAI